MSHSKVKAGRRLLVVLLALLLASCNQSESNTSQATPKRVVSLLPSATELLFAVGAGDSLVGVTLNDNYPPEVADLPKVGDQTIDLEKMISLNPDLVILDSNFNNDKERLERLGIPVLELRCERLADVAPAMLALGEALGVEKKAVLTANKFREKLSAVEPLMESESVFIEVWSDPLMTAGSETLLDDVLQRVGVQNCYSDQVGYFQVDPEDVVTRSPGIIIWPKGDETELDSRAFALLNQTNQEARVVIVDPDLLVRPGPRILDGIKFLRNSLQDTH